VAEILSSWDSILFAVIYIFLADFCGQPLTHSMVVRGQIFVEDSWAVSFFLHLWIASFHTCVDRSEDDLT
jgi:hypothetical protein